MVDDKQTVVVCLCGHWIAIHVQYHQVGQLLKASNPFVNTSSTKQLYATFPFPVLFFFFSYIYVYISLRYIYIYILLFFNAQPPHDIFGEGGRKWMGKGGGGRV